jgi:hypothetical protein
MQVGIVSAYIESGLLPDLVLMRWRAGPISPLGQGVIWLSGIDIECELAVPTVMIEPGGSWARAGATNIAKVRAAIRATRNVFMGMMLVWLSWCFGKLACICRAQTLDWRS